MKLLYCIFVYVRLLSLSSAATPATESLPTCELNTEIQFYTAEFDILGLPEACNENTHLTTLGFLIQVRSKVLFYSLDTLFLILHSTTVGCGV
jgi:hypothetical protein